MNTILNQLSEYLWHQSWQVTILIGVALILCHVLRHKSAHLRYMVWLVVLAKCLVPPIFHVPVAVLPAEAMIQPLSTQGMSDFDPAALGSGAEETIPSQATKASWYSHGLALVKHHRIVTAWAMVAILITMISAFRMIRIRRRLLGHRTPVPESVQTDLDLVCQHYGVARRPRAWLFSQTSQPFVWGWLTGAIYLPNEFESKAPEHRQAILAHELGHVCRYDAAVNLLQVLAQGIFWFHPLVWWANAQMRKAREQCCDEMAMAHMGINVKTYCSALINALVASEKNSHPMGSLAISSPAKHIEQRIKIIMTETKFYTRPPVTAVISIGVMALLLVSTSCSLCKKQPKTTGTQLAPPYTILITADQMKDPNTILIETLFLECSDGGQQLKAFLKDESLLASGQRMITRNSEDHHELVPFVSIDPKRMSLEVETKPLKPTVRDTYFLTTQQQDQLKRLSQVKVVASPKVKAAFGKPAQIQIVTEEYYMIPPPSDKRSHAKSELKMIESGLKLDLTPNLTETENEIAIDLKLDVTDSFPHTLPSGEPGLPIITRRTSRHRFTMNRDVSMLFISPGANEEPASAF